MKDPILIKEIAWDKLDEASILLKNKKFDGAFYLAGYSVELMLKYKICESWGVPNLFDFDDKNVGNYISKLRGVVKIHNLLILLVLSALKVKFDVEKARDKKLLKAYSLLSLMFDKWSEHVRYLPSGSANPNEVKQLIDLLKNKKGLLKWIEIN